jgi:hypothetical protein
MGKNVGIVDQIIRIIIAIVFLVLNFKGIVTDKLAMFLLIMAMYFIVTSLIRVCPLYFPFGISTRKEEE